MGVPDMKRRYRIVALVAVTCFAFFLIASAASAHVPQFAEGGASMQTATVIDQGTEPEEMEPAAS